MYDDWDDDDDLDYDPADASGWDDDDDLDDLEGEFDSLIGDPDHDLL